MLSTELSEILTKIINEELKLVNVELELMTMAHEVGYQGFKRLHRYNSRDRLEHALRLQNFIVENFGKAIHFSVSYESNKYTFSSIVDAFNAAIQSSKDHLELLKTAANLAITNNEHHLMGKLECMIKDQEHEKHRYERLVLAISNTKYDSVYLQLKSEKLHCKYKKKENKYQGRKIK